MPLSKIVAQNIRSYRVDRNLSQETLAAKAGISVSYISMLERAQRSPPLHTLSVLADALRVSPLLLVQARRT